MGLADGLPIKLKSVMFHADVRLPGSSMTGRYIPSEDYPLTFYPASGVIEARLRHGIKPLANFTSRAFYMGIGCDMQLADGEVEVSLSTNDAGQLIAPTHKMVSRPDGSFERVTEEEEAATTPATPAALAAPAKRTRGPNKPKPGAAVVTPHAPRAPAVLVQHPGARAGAGSAQGGA